MGADGYKLIQMPVPASEKPTVELIIDSVNRLFDRDDFYLDMEGGVLCAHLSAVDMRALSRALETLPKSEAAARLFEEIKNEKSHGVRRGKRMFVADSVEKPEKLEKKPARSRGRRRKPRPEDDVNELPDYAADKIVCAESEDVLKTLPERCVDIVLTSLPKSPEGGEDAYFDKVFAALCECERVLKYGGRMIIDIEPKFFENIPTHHMIGAYLSKIGMLWKGEIMWEKGYYNRRYTAWGSWKSPSSPHLKYTWEFLEVFCKGSLKKHGRKEDIDVSPDEFKRWISAKWEIAPDRDDETGEKTNLPEELVERALKMFSYKGDVVLDPFCGKGTVPLVAEKNGRRYVGIDPSEESCKIARRRIETRMRQCEF